MNVRKTGIAIDDGSVKIGGKVIKKRFLYAKKRYNRYIELQRGEGETVIVPLDHSDYKKLLQEGYTAVIAVWERG